MYIFIITIHFIYFIINITNNNIDKYKNYENFYFKNYKFINNLFNFTNFSYIDNTVIKYNKNYSIRNYIDFENDELIIETIINKDIENILINELKNILNSYNLYSYYIKKNFDFINNDIYIKLKLNKYFEYLFNFSNNKKEFLNVIRNEKIRFYKTDFNKIIFFIKIKLIVKNIFYNNIEDLEKIEKKSFKYNIDFFLLLSIIKAESNFNQFAISKSGAIGLMQIIQKKSGIDVFKKLGKNNFPNIEYLLDFNKNIKVGLIYILILKNDYFNKILDKKSLRYLIISSYNGGAKSVINIFSKNNNKFIKIINSMNSSQVYNYIIKYHPSLSIRKYLIKVNKIYIKYKLNNFVNK